MKPKKIVIIGGPGTGKTSLINALIDRGYDCKIEISRKVTRKAQTSGIDQIFLEDPIWFSEQLLEARITQFTESNLSKSNFVFFDRGIPDVVAYLDYINVKYDQKFVISAETFKYDKVFILSPWKLIYSQDNERYETFEQALEIQNYLIKWYKYFGYNPIEVPKVTINQRVDFILNNV